ncbi:hypothetical protein T492DRAFT_160943 [Pavlovales sp. CCMP2436]|nr:hypothetical protein T492DRAFT_160943 [Pavlovales sp. CCMP2436]
MDERGRMGGEFEAMRSDLVRELEARDAELEAIRAQAIPLNEAEAMRADLETGWGARLGAAEEEIGRGREALERARRNGKQAVADAEARAVQSVSKTATRELRLESELNDARAQIERLRRAADGDGSSGVLGGERLRALQRERLELQLRADSLRDENDSLRAEMDAALADAEARVRAAAAVANDERASAQVARAELASLTRRVASLGSELESATAAHERAHAYLLGLEVELRRARDETDSSSHKLSSVAAAAELRAVEAARAADRARDEGGHRASELQQQLNALRAAHGALQARLLHADAASSHSSPHECSAAPSSATLRTQPYHTHTHASSSASARVPSLGGCTSPLAASAGTPSLGGGNPAAEAEAIAARDRNLRAELDGIKSRIAACTTSTDIAGSK